MPRGGAVYFSKNVVRAQLVRDRVAERQPFKVEVVAEMPEIPVLLETILRLDLLVQEPCVDLRVLSDVVLSDLGATLQLLHLAGREYGHSEGRPTRIEDCIADLGLHACMAALSVQTVIRARRHQAIGAIWAHSREVAQYSRLIAEEMPNVNPDEAYLVGLLHGVGLLPEVLGWNENEAGVANAARMGFRLAKRWTLPYFVLQFFSELQMGGRKTHWLEIMRSAHWRASRTSGDCPCGQDAGPVLLRLI
jgi:HD-like signal output (HDOD) protein